MNLDGLQAKLLKHGIDPLVMPLDDLFQLIVCSSSPNSCTQHIIHPIHKLEDPREPNNYKTIMIRHYFAKLYTTTLNLFLLRKLEEEGHSATDQVGFHQPPNHKPYFVPQDHY